MLTNDILLNENITVNTVFQKREIVLKYFYEEICNITALSFYASGMPT